MWTFEQEQALGFSNVTTNVRMTVIKLRSGGLWVHAPIAPTKWVAPLYICICTETSGLICCARLRARSSYIMNG